MLHGQKNVKPDAEVTDFCLHIRPVPHPSQSVYTLYIFLSLSNSFLSVSVDDCTVHVSSHCGKFSMLVHIVRNVSYSWFL
jgi:hypothetical protein